MPGDNDPNSGNHVHMYNDKSSFKCEINKDSNNDKGIQCWTPPGIGDIGTLKIKVRADGVDSNTKTWRATDDYTPTLEKLKPQQCEPGTVVNAEGKMYTGMWNSTMNTNQIENTDICTNRCALRRVYNRGSQCNLYDENDPAGGVYGVYLNDIFDGPDGGFKCKLGGSYVGNQNFTYMIDGEYGRSRTKSKMKRIDPNGNLYDVQTYAVVTGVNTHRGGINGGNIITISGRWFWEGKTEVKVSGKDCEIISVTDTEIKCRVPKGEETIEGKWYPGSRGLTMSIWDDKDGDPKKIRHYSYEQMSELNLNTSTADESFELDVMKWVGITDDTPEGDDYKTVRFQGITEGFFAPALDSKYAFVSWADNWGKAYFTGEKFTDGEDLRINTTHYRKDKELFDLKGGEYYPFALTHQDWGGASWGQLNVWQEDNVWLTPEQQSDIPKRSEHGFHLTADHFIESQTIIFNNLPGNLKDTSGNKNQQTHCFSCSSFGDECWIQFQVFGHKTEKVIFTSDMKADVKSAFSGHQFYNNVNAQDAACGQDSEGNDYFGFTIIGAPDHELIKSLAVEIVSSTENEAGENYPINAIIPRLNGIAALDPIQTIDKTNLQTAAESIANNYCPEYFGNDMGLSSSQVKMHHQFNEDQDLSCYTHLSTESSFCGSKSRKGYPYLFQEFHNNFKQDCSKGAQQMPFKADTFKYMCLAYKGDINVERLHFIVQYTEKATGRKHERHTWTGNWDENWKGDDSWKHRCINIKDRVDSMFAHDYDNVKNLYIKRIYVLGRGSEYWVDNILISKTNPADEAAYKDAINARVEKNVAAVELTEVVQSGDNYTVSYTPVECGYGYPLIDFAFMDEVDVSVDGNMATYRHSSWPSEANIQVVRNSAATPPITGKVIFDYPQLDTPVELELETLHAWGYYAEQAFKTSGVKVDLHWDKRECYEKKFRVWWYVGGQQELPEVDTSMIGGQNLEYEYTKRYDGGLYFQGTMGTEWFVKREYKPQVQVVVNGIMSDCQGDCSYEYDASLSATVTSISGSEFSGGDTITISGTNLANAVVEQPPCTINESDFDQIVCTLPDGLAGGSYDLLVSDDELGQATGSFSLKISSSVDSVTPSTGSRYGATEITIDGTSLDVMAEVTIGGVVCETILSKSSATQIVCKTGEISSPENTDDDDVEISLGGVGSGVTFGYYNSVTPLITSSAFSGNKNRLSVSGGEGITLVGDKFSSTNEENFVFYNGEVEKSVRPTYDESTTSLTFDTASMDAGNYDIQILVKGVGLSDKLSVKYFLKVTAISAQEMSYYGGKEVTVTGKGFGDDKEVVDVLMNNKPGTIDSLSDTEIVFKTPSMANVHVLKSNGNFDDENSLKWDDNSNGGKLEIYVGDAVRFEWDYNHMAGSYHKMHTLCESPSLGKDSCKTSDSSLFNIADSKQKWHDQHKTKDGEVLIKFNKNFINQTIYFMSQHSDSWRHRLFGSITVLERPASLDVNFDVQVSEKSAVFDVSKRKKRSLSGLSFTLSDDLTINVDSISPQQVPVLTGEITISGSNFGFDTIVEVGGIACNHESQTQTEIICKVSTTGMDKDDLGVWLEVEIYNSEGNAAFHTESRSVVLLPEITGISPATGSTNGGTEVTVTGAGLTVDDLYILFDYSDDCEIKSVTDFFEAICITPQPSNSYPNIPSNRSQIVTVNSGENRRAPTFVFSLPDEGINFVTDKDLTALVGQPTWTDNRLVKGTEFTFTIDNLQGGDPEVYLGNAKCSQTAKSGNEYTCVLDENPTSLNWYVEMQVIDTTGYAFVNVSSNRFRQNMKIYSVSPTEGSYRGGQKITITGDGFAEFPVPKVNNELCEVVSSSLNEIVCITPEGHSSRGEHVVTMSHFNSDIKIDRNTGKCPKVTGVKGGNAQVYASGDTLTFTVSRWHENGTAEIYLDGVLCPFDSKSGSERTWEVSCIVPLLMGGPIDEIKIYNSLTGKAVLDNDDYDISYKLSVDSFSPSSIAMGGGIKITLTGDGFDNSSTVTVCDESVKVEFTDSTELIIVAPPAPAFDTDQTCDIKVFTEISEATATNQLTYSMSKTPTVTGVNPARGGTAGGTKITVSGTGFDPSTFTVSIAGTECTMNVGESSATELVCVTNAFVRGRDSQPLIKVSGPEGDAYNAETTYYYIDRWNSVYTWGGEEPPRENEFVVISEGQTVLLDGDTNNLLFLLVDGGTLLFDGTQDCHLQAQNILIVNGGAIIAGSEEAPHPSNILITMHGHARSLELPVYGAKTLGVRDGILELHGHQKHPAWTYLEATVQAGSDTIELLQEVNWSVGDRIMIATTSHINSQAENEEAVIKSIAGDKKTITLEAPLEFMHLGHVETLENGEILPMRAEVGVLTRSIKFQGSDNMQWHDKIEACPDGFDNGEFATQTCFQGRFGDELGSDEFGGCIMIHPKAPATGKDDSKAIARLDNIEVWNAGQAFRLARYPIHFHFQGNARNSYIRGCSIWKAFNRAMVFHHTNYLKFDGNVVYNVMGGAIFVENGNEMHNEITHNMASFVKSSTSLLNDDITPATIWITNPNNLVAHNSVGGSTHFGIWYRMNPHPEDTSYDPNVCPDLQSFGTYTNNTVHSCGWFGLWVFENYFPHAGESCDKEIGTVAKFTDSYYWRLDKGIEFFETGAMQAINSVIAETKHAGLEWKRVWNTQWGEDGAMIVNTTIAARTSKYRTVFKNYHICLWR